MIKKKFLDEFSELNKQDWKDKVRKDLKDKDYNELLWKTAESFSLEPYYTSAELPKTIGVPTDQDREGNSWSIMGVIDSSTKKERINKFKEEGVEAFILEGSNLSIEKLDALVSQINPSEYPLYLDETSKENFFVLASSFIHKSEAKLDWKGGFRADPLSDSGLSPRERILKLESLAVDLSFIERNLSDWTLWDIQPDRKEAKSEEIAEALFSANSYLAGLIEVGFEAEEIAKRLNFSFNIGISYLMEIGKLRAFRICFDKIQRAYGIENTAAAKINCFGDESGLQIQNPENNLIQLTAQGMASVIGGCNGLYLPAYNSKKESTARLSTNIQLILKHEALLDIEADPLRGSFSLEVLTDKLARAAWKSFQEKEAARDA